MNSGVESGYQNLKGSLTDSQVKKEDIINETYILKYVLYSLCI